MGKVFTDNEVIISKSDYYAEFIRIKSDEFFDILNSNFMSIWWVYHFDLYRINDISELDAIGAEEYFYGDGISFVEWPERASGMFPSSAIKVYIEKLGEAKRKIRIER